VVAGEAAIVAQARPSLTADELHSALAGTAARLPDAPQSAQGNGLVSIGAAAGAEVVAAPVAVSFGRASRPGYTATRPVALSNVSTRWLRVFLAVPRHDPAVAVSVDPKAMTLAPGETADVAITVRLRTPTSAAVVSGLLTVAPLTGTPIRVPWALVTAPVAPGLIGTVQLSAGTFKPSDVAPSILLVQLGQVETREAGISIEPVLRLDIRLRDGHGKDLGLLSRLRDVLPGRYAFGLTGRGPNGGTLTPGRYSLALRAFPAVGGPPVTRSVDFTIR
jgi:hypothetical protein